MLKLGRAGGPRGDRPTVGLQIVGIEGRSGPYSINLCLIWTKLNYLLRIPCLGPRSERNGKIAHQKRSVNRIDSPCTVEAAACSFDQRLLFRGLFAGMASIMDPRKPILLVPVLLVNWTNIALSIGVAIFMITHGKSLLVWGYIA